MASRFEGLRGEDFVVLTSYRRSGEPVPTTVWFAEQDGVVFVTTRRGLGKVKRMTANPRVTLAPSDRVGNVHGPAVAARARLLGPEEAGVAERALREKYGETYVRMTGQMDTAMPGHERVYLELVSTEIGADTAG